MATTVHPSANVDAGTRVGAHCSFGQNMFVANVVRIGSNAKSQNNVSVYVAVTLGADVYYGLNKAFTNVCNLRSAVTPKDAYRRTQIRRGDEPRCARFALMLGVPAHQSGWTGRHGERPDLPPTGDGEARYPHTNDRCTLNTGSVSLAGA